MEKLLKHDFHDWTICVLPPTDNYHILCKVHGTVNDLLKEVKYAYDSEEPLYLAGARVLGLLSKLGSAPLWRLIESPGHILDINVHYHPCPIP